MLLVHAHKAYVCIAIDLRYKTTPAQTTLPHRHRLNESRERVQKQKESADKANSLASTRSGNRTRTAITGHRILSPACLPIPPSEPFWSCKGSNKNDIYKKCYYSAFFVAVYFTRIRFIPSRRGRITFSTLLSLRT